MRLWAWGQSDPGRKRERNEDSYLVDTETGVVAAFSPALEVMRGVVKRASSAIFEASWAKPELRGMGTTLTAMLVHGGRAHVVHAGDSRCYVFRDGQLRQLTEDHSWIAEQ